MALLDSFDCNGEFGLLYRLLVFPPFALYDAVRSSFPRSLFQYDTAFLGRKCIFIAPWTSEHGYIGAGIYSMYSMHQNSHASGVDRRREIRAGEIDRSMNLMVDWHAAATQICMLPFPPGLIIRIPRRPTCMLSLTRNWAGHLWRGGNLKRNSSERIMSFRCRHVYHAWKTDRPGASLACLRMKN